MVRGSDHSVQRFFGYPILRKAKVSCFLAAVLSSDLENCIFH
jgi:hypothetical protein